MCIYIYAYIFIYVYIHMCVCVSVLYHQYILKSHENVWNGFGHVWTPSFAKLPQPRSRAQRSISARSHPQQWIDLMCERNVAWGNQTFLYISCTQHVNFKGHFMNKYEWYITIWWCKKWPKLHIKEEYTLEESPPGVPVLLEVLSRCLPGTEKAKFLTWSAYRLYGKVASQKPRHPKK